MMMRRDEPRHDDRARAVDDLSIGCGDGGRNLGDCFPVDQDIRLLEVAQPGVEREHHPSPQEDAAPSPVPDQPLKLLWSRGA